MLPEFLQESHAAPTIFPPKEYRHATYKNREEKEETAISSTFGYLSQGFFTVVDSAKELGKKTKDKLEEAKIGEKLSQVGTVIAAGTVTAGAYMYDKTKVAAASVVQKGKELAVCA